MVYAIASACFGVHVTNKVCIEGSTHQRQTQPIHSGSSRYFILYFQTENHSFACIERTKFSYPLNETSSRRNFLYLHKAVLNEQFGND